MITKIQNYQSTIKMPTSNPRTTTFVWLTDTKSLLGSVKPLITNKYHLQAEIYLNPKSLPIEIHLFLIKKKRGGGGGGRILFLFKKKNSGEKKNIKIFFN